MAPRKKTEEKASASEATDMVLHYLHTENRPYSAIDVSVNLHNRVTKTAAAKILKDLHEENRIVGCSSGKQIVYHAIQDPDETCTPEELAALDKQIEDTRNEISKLQADAKVLRSTLAKINSTPSIADLRSSVQALESEKAELIEQLKVLKAENPKQVTAKEREDVEKEWKLWTSAAKKRKKIARDLWLFIEDQLPDEETGAQLREAFGLDE